MQAVMIVESKKPMDTHSQRTQVYLYHDETKHHLHRYARSAGFLDWATQPDAFRSWEGARSILLPLLKKDPEGSHLDLYHRKHNVFWDFHSESIGAFLELSLGLSAWKQIPPDGGRWALRMNPSSGNLHPTEAHLILPPIIGKTRLGQIEKDETFAAFDSSAQGGVYHYQAYRHALEQRAALPADYVRRLRMHFQTPGFLIVLTSIAWREAWKYGERALRYCQHDIGHALGAISFAANLLGWRATRLNAVSTGNLRQILGFQNRVWPSLENEDPEVICFVSPASVKAIPRTLPDDWVHAMESLSWQGQPSRLSADHVEWDLLTQTAHVLDKPVTHESSVGFELKPMLEHPVSSVAAATLIRRRRSAVAYDGKTTLTRDQFFALLDKTMPRPDMAPFDLEIGLTHVHLAIFVHRVIGLPSGLYLLLRDASAFTDLKRNLKHTFEWRLLSPSLPLYLLQEGEFQDHAAHISCGQSIAGKSAFSLGMLARFRSVVDVAPWDYKTLFWECGLIGQVLYLEAEAQGVRGTGIGCFFDDLMHDVLGLRDNNYQSLYHFTVGGAVEDVRLQTLPAYTHLPADRR